MRNSAVLLIACPDKKGLVAAIANFLLRHNANILHADQHQDGAAGLFLMRVEWSLEGFELGLHKFDEAFGPIAAEHHMAWTLSLSSVKPRLAIFVSKFDHCLADLLYRHHAGELYCDIPLIISNHPDTHWLAEAYKIPFQHIHVTKDNKAEAEAQQRAILAAHHVDFIVLARYMQVLSREFIAHYPNRIINIHHSFLPGFKGAKPYHEAHRRGVKLIGATAHYVTADLDEGPIIEQTVERADHTMSPDDLAAIGRDVESITLARAVKLHIEHRVFVNGSKTVVLR